MPPKDDTSTISDLKEMVREFCEERDWDQFHNSKDLAIGIVTEASELLQLLRFKDESEIEEMMISDRRERIVGELSDTLYFVLRFAQMNGIKTIAEGVETAEELRAVISYGVDLIQGFYTAKPSPEPLETLPDKIKYEIVSAGANNLNNFLS